MSGETNASVESVNPRSRLTDAEIADLQVVVATELAADTRAAMEANFPIEQLPDFELLTTRLKQGFVSIHELRSKETGELLSSRMIVDYPSRERGELQFLLVSFVVTPDGGAGGADSKQSKSKGYGSYLRQKSMEISRKHKPHAFALLAERESPRGAAGSDDQRVRRASWMSRIGLFIVEGLEYDIPPLVHGGDKDKYIPVARRAGHTHPADLMLFRFDGKDTIDGKNLRSVVGRLYANGYNIATSDPWFIERMARIDAAAQYRLLGG